MNRIAPMLLMPVILPLVAFGIMIRFVLEGIYVGTLVYEDLMRRWDR